MAQFSIPEVLHLDPTLDDGFIIPRLDTTKILRFTIIVFFFFCFLHRLYHLFLKPYMNEIVHIYTYIYIYIHIYIYTHTSLSFLKYFFLYIEFYSGSCIIPAYGIYHSHQLLTLSIADEKSAIGMSYLQLLFLVIPVACGSSWARAGIKL